MRCVKISYRLSLTAWCDITLSQQLKQAWGLKTGDRAGDMSANYLFPAATWVLGNWKMTGSSRVTWPTNYPQSPPSFEGDQTHGRMRTPELGKALAPPPGASQQPGRGDSPRSQLSQLGSASAASPGTPTPRWALSEGERGTRAPDCPPPRSIR